MSETSLLSGANKRRPQAVGPAPYSSVDDISSMNQTSGSSSSDESPSEKGPSNESSVPSPINAAQTKDQQKSLSGNLSVLKEICAAAISSDGLYDSSMPSIKNINTSSGVPRSTNYMGDSCTSFEFLNNANSAKKSDRRGDECLSPKNHVLKEKEGNNSPIVCKADQVTYSPTVQQEKLTETENLDDGSAPSTGNRKDSSSQTEKSYVKGNRISDFEKEIKKLLDRQHLPQVDELASVQKVLSVMGKLR